MNPQKTGKLIMDLRKEKGWTQKQLADCLHLSDKTISKWERGIGCPDISLLPALARLFGIDSRPLLDGEFVINGEDSDDMKKIQFYRCPDCGNIISSVGPAEVTCCGKMLTALPVQKPDQLHNLKIETVEDEWYMTCPNHPMTKEHYVTFIAAAGCNHIHLIRTYPEQELSVRFPKRRKMTLYYCCNEHGLYRMDL